MWADNPAVTGSPQWLDNPIESGYSTKQQKSNYVLFDFI